MLLLSLTKTMTSTDLSGKCLLLGICGSIAAYKSAYLVRELRRRGAEVRVIMTHSAEAFITRLSLQGLSGHPVESQQFDGDSSDGMKHIALTRWADVIVVAPATANFIAKLANGMADDLLSTVCIASDIPLIIAPAMNRLMWEHPLVQANVQKLIALDMMIWGPECGEQACGESGSGRMIEPEAIAQKITTLLGAKPLDSTRVVITAGPTHEMLDPVRYLSNHSSGRMGFALAQAAAEAGAEVSLIAGPARLPTPHAVQRYDVLSAEQMLQAVLAQIDGADIFIGCAAVSDYRPAQVHPQKLKRDSETLSLELVRNPDILATVGKRHPRPFLVGFAAETEALVVNAKQKLLAKNLDMIVANPVGVGQAYGFDSVDNQVSIYWRGGEMNLGPDSKIKIGEAVIKQIIARYHLKTSDETIRTA